MFPHRVYRQDWRWPKGVVFAWLALSALVAGDAVGAEWTLAAGISERIEADTNFNLEKGEDDPVIGSTTSIGLALGARTKSTQWNLSTGTRLSVFLGDGEDAGLNRADPSLAGDVIHRAKDFSANAAFEFTRQPVAFTQFGIELPSDGTSLLPDGSVERPDGTVALGSDFATVTQEEAVQTDVRFAGGFSVPLNTRNRVSASANGALVRFSEDIEELAANTSFGVQIGWARDLTKLTATDFSVTVSRFTVDDAQDTRSTTVSFNGGFSTRLTPQLDLTANTGVALVRNNSDARGSGDTDVEAIGGLALGWRNDKTQMSLLISHGVETSSLGELQNRTTLALGAGYLMNSTSRLALNTSYSRQVSSGGFAGNGTNRQLFVLSPSYARDLDRNWTMQAGYALRLSDEETGFAASNNLFLSFSRSFDLLP